MLSASFVTHDSSMDARPALLLRRALLALLRDRVLLHSAFSAVRCARASESTSINIE